MDNNMIDFNMINFLSRVVFSTTDKSVKEDALKLLEIEKVKIEASLGYKDLAWHLIPATVVMKITEAVDTNRDVDAIKYLREEIEMTLAEAKYHIYKLKTVRALNCIDYVEMYLKRC